MTIDMFNYQKIPRLINWLDSVFKRYTVSRIKGSQEYVVYFPHKYSRQILDVQVNPERLEYKDMITLIESHYRR